MFKTSTIFAAVAVVGLSACAGIDTDAERALVGAAGGCIAGETLGSGNNCVEGALAGAAAGALLNDVTNR